MVNKFIQSLTQNQTVDLIRSVTDQLEKTLGTTIDNNARVKVLISMRKEVEAERKWPTSVKQQQKVGSYVRKLLQRVGISADGICIPTNLYPTNQRKRISLLKDYQRTSQRLNQKWNQREKDPIQ